MTGPVRTGHLDLDADLAAVRALGPWLAELLDDGPADLRSRLELALHEVCVNVVEHAYAGTGGRIGVEGRVDDREVRLRVRDGGRPYAPVPGGPALPTEVQVGGYGLAIARQLVDELRYERVGEENVWELATGRRPAGLVEDRWTS